jgi:hypothetical protein
MRPRDDCIINNNNTTGISLLSQKPFQLPAKPLHKVFVSENIFHQAKIQ